MPRQRNIKPTSIYWLIDNRPETIASGWPIGRPFYCGKTVLNINRRLQSHSTTVGRWPKRKLSLALREIGAAFSIRVMEVVPCDGDWCARERHWIKLLRHLNPDCANTADGGQGAPGYIPTAEHRAKLRIASSGRKHSEETLAKLRRPRRPKKWIFTPEHRAKLSAANKNSPRAIAQRERNRATLTGRKFSDEHRANLSAARKRSPKAMAVAMSNLQKINGARNGKISAQHAEALHEGRRRHAKQKRG